MGKRANSSAAARHKDQVATKRDIQALAMGMAANIDNLAVGLVSAVRFMQKQHRALEREVTKLRRSHRRAS